MGRLLTEDAGYEAFRQLAQLGPEEAQFQEIRHDILKVAQLFGFQHN
jgi:hypothetical protein